MDSFEFYQLFLAAQRHFSDKTNYDFFKYNGKTNCSERSFNVTNGKYHFEKHARKLRDKNQAIHFLAGNYFYEDIKFVGSLSREPYRLFMSYGEALNYKFEQDLIKYTTEKNVLKDLFSGSKDPIIYLVILDRMYSGKIFKAYDKQQEGNLLWEHHKDRVMKFYDFIPHCFELSAEKYKILNNLVQKTTK